MLIKDPKALTLLRLKSKLNDLEEEQAEETPAPVQDKQFLELAEKMAEILARVSEPPSIEVGDNSAAIQALKSTMDTFIREMRRKKTFSVEIERDTQGLSTRMLLKEV